MAIALDGLGAVLMGARLSPIDDMHISDLQGPSPAAAPVPLVIVALWPLVVMGIACVALYMLPPPPRRRLRPLRPRVARFPPRLRSLWWRP